MNTLVNFRVMNNLTQKEMANKVGITLTLYSKIELGVRNPSYNFLVKFKQAFKDVDVDKLFFNDQQHNSCS